MRSLHVSRIALYALAAFFAGCAGLDRGCSSCIAENFAADWVVVQMDVDGDPFRCWGLRDTSITNESQSDGIYWKAPEGNLVHLSGFYNRVQVEHGAWDQAFREVGLTKESCAAIHDQIFNIETGDYEPVSQK